MGSLPDFEPGSSRVDIPGVVLVIDPRPRDLGGFSVRRLLPVAGHRMVQLVCRSP